ncbi:MAG TPA: cytochrome b [Chromatiales bacterium]|nr:cytochrome b [Thiotrichales bacterium]HIP67153.1 cytochrome b [Chromatiales bacterium]
MMLKNTGTSYGLIAILFHWVMAVMIFVLFPLGIYMTSLDYYDRWYRISFSWHESIGMLVLMLLIFRLFWRWLNQKPDPHVEMSRWQSFAANVAHWLFYVFIFVVCLSGYFISTAEGQGINIWDFVTVPAVSSFESGFSDKAGVVHWYAALMLIALACVHTLAALYHHFILKDRILINIIKGDRNER